MINDEFDYLTAALQQLAVETEASLRRAPTDPVVEMTLPAATARANRILAFDGNGRPLAESKDAIAAIIRHGAVRDLGNDDHPQYLTDYRADAWLAQHSLDDLREGVTVKRFTGMEKAKLASLPANAEANPPRVSDQEKVEAQVTDPRTFSPRDIAEVAARVGGSNGGGLESVHSALLGLQADDHLQYLTTERADAWLAAKTADDVSDGTVNRYMTLGGNGAADVAARADHNHAGIYEPAFAKNTAFNRNFGTASDEVAAGNHGHDAAAITTGVVDMARLPVVGGDAGSGGTAGCAPAPAAGDAAAGKFLAADGTWRAPSARDGIGSGESFPPAPQAGDAFYRTDLATLFIFEGVRGKWLGELESDGAGLNNDHDAGYLKRFNGALMSASIGILIPYDITIVGLSMAWVNARSGAIHVHRNGVVVANLVFPTTTTVAEMNLDADVAAGGILAFSTSGHTNPLSMPQLRCWWRRRAI